MTDLSRKTQALSPLANSLLKDKISLWTVMSINPCSAQTHSNPPASDSWALYRREPAHQAVACFSVIYQNDMC